MRAFLQVASRTPGVGGGAAYVTAAGGERLVGHTANRGQEPRLSIPIVVDGRPIGHLELDAGSRPLTDRDAAILRAAGENLGTALADRAMTWKGGAVFGFGVTRRRRDHMREGVRSSRRKCGG